MENSPHGTPGEALHPASTDFLPLDDSNNSDPQETSDDAADSSNGDSASDVSMAADSDDEDDQDPQSSSDPAMGAINNPQGNPSSLGAVSSRKRKSLDEDPADHTTDISLSAGPSKKVKLDDGEIGDSTVVERLPRKLPQLPAEIWHHIFTFCPPRTLGNLLLVNRLFNMYLDPASRMHCETPTNSLKVIVPYLKPNAVWQASRRSFWLNMPAPLQDKSELDMWRLSCSRTCQLCEEVQDISAPADPSHPGPGMTGVATIWPFRVRSCGPCLLRNSIKEIDILLSSSVPASLIPALPYVVINQELHAFSSVAVERGQLPAGPKPPKLFWSADVEKIKSDFLEVRGLGAAATEEWLKGLKGQGNERQNDFAKWENWANLGGLVQMRNVLYPGYRRNENMPNRTTRQAQEPELIDLASVKTPAAELQSILPPAYAAEVSTPQDPLSANGNSSTGSIGLAQARHERTKEEVAELKALRKAEIERRALFLVPPLTPSVLAHIPSFQAAIQIITPFDDKAWDLLKPRLLAQRAEAEQRERETIAQTRLKQELDEKRITDSPTKDAREVMDADWDEIQAPVRARIARFADEIIKNSWDDGDKVNKENSPRFAAEVLVYIRKRFYAEVAKDAEAARAAGKELPPDPPQGPFTQKLTLENMKWIFDTKVRPHTEPYRKELFLCNGCDNTIRYYGFEGVVQHYAAKHTTALSSGNVVVHWRAEWPAHPPFTPDGKPLKSTYFNPAIGQPYPSSTGTPTTQYGYGTYQPGPAVPPPHPYTAYPGVSAQPYVAPAYAEQYPPLNQPSYPPPGGYAPQNYSQASYAPDPYQQYHSAPQQVGPYPPTQPTPHNFPAVGSAPPVSQSMPTVTGGQYGYNYGAYQSNAQVGHTGGTNAPYGEQYRKQLEDMARNAREVWNATSNMKDVAGSVRVHVVIHHVAKRFHSKFNETPSLTMFIDGLSNNKDMRPVRNVNGLMCKTCRLGLGNYMPTEQEKKSFSLPQLANHFQSQHIEVRLQMDPYTSPPDWVTEMVLLPDPASMSNLRLAVGTDSQKSYLVSDAIPEAFQPVNLPQGLPYSPWPTSDLNTQQPPPSIDNHAKYYASAPPSNEASSGGQASILKQDASTSSPYPPQSYDPSGGYAQNYKETGPTPNPQNFGPLSAYRQPNAPPVARNIQNGKQDNSDKKSSHGSRQSRDHGSRSKKNKKKSNAAVDAAESAAAKITEEEAKMAEEEERRQEEEIRAMWAADRAEAARKSTRPEDTNPTSGRGGRSRLSSEQPSKTHTPLQPQRQPSVQRRSPPREREEPSLMDALDMHLREPPTVGYEDHVYRQPPSNVIYVDDREPSARLDVQRGPQRYQTFESTMPAHLRPRSGSPTYVGSGHPSRVQQYRERSPPPPPAPARFPEPQYQPRGQPLPSEDIRYERTPREDYYARPYQEEHSRPPLPRATEYVEYEIVEVRDSQGTFFIERPVRRRADPEPYYPLYEREPPLRREYESFPPVEQAYSRPAPPTAYEPQHAVIRPEPPPPPPVSRTDPAYYEEYDPRFPAAPPSNPPRQVRYQ